MRVTTGILSTTGRATVRAGVRLGDREPQGKPSRNDRRGHHSAWILVAISHPCSRPTHAIEPMKPMQPVGAIAGGGTFWLRTDHVGRDILSRLDRTHRTVSTTCRSRPLTAYAVGILTGLPRLQGALFDEQICRAWHL